jgi:hypothetical protein
MSERSPKLSPKRQKLSDKGEFPNYGRREHCEEASHSADFVIQR